MVFGEMFAKHLLCAQPLGDGLSWSCSPAADPKTGYEDTQLVGARGRGRHVGVQRQAPRPASHGFITQRHVSRGRTRHVAALALGGGCPRVPFPAPRLGLGWRRPGGAEVVAGSPPCARGIYRRVDGEVAPGPFEPGPCKGDPGRPPGSALPQAPVFSKGKGGACHAPVGVALSRAAGPGARLSSPSSREGSRPRGRTLKRTWLL